MATATATDASKGNDRALSRLLIRGVATLGFPKADLDDRQPRPLGLLEDEPGDVFGGRVLVHDEDAFALSLQDGQDWVFAAKQQVVVDVLVHPALDGLLDVGEVDEHAPGI